MVDSLCKLSYSERLNSLGLTTLAARRMLGDLIETYEVLTHKERIDPNQFFLFSDTGCALRGHSLKLYTGKPSVKTQHLKAILQLLCNQFLESIASACGRSSNCEHFQEQTR